MFFLANSERDYARAVAGLSAKCCHGADDDAREHHVHGFHKVHVARISAKQNTRTMQMFSVFREEQSQIHG